MRLTAQLTTLERNPVAHLAYGGAGILDEEDYASLEDVELALEDADLDAHDGPQLAQLSH